MNLFAGQRTVVNQGQGSIYAYFYFMLVVGSTWSSVPMLFSLLKVPYGARRRLSTAGVR